MVRNYPYICCHRGVLFYTCRRYLLRSLYHDLQDLSSEGRVISPAELDADALELETLPTHSVSKAPISTSAANHGAASRNRIFHSFISRTLFALSFSESCTLFLLLMCQGLEIFHPKCVHDRAFTLRTDGCLPCICAGHA